jgi:hypothetical protein
VKATLAAEYPNDKAVGYSAGMIRGVLHPVHPVVGEANGNPGDWGKVKGGNPPHSPFFNPPPLPMSDSTRLPACKTSPSPGSP